MFFTGGGLPAVLTSVPRRLFDQLLGATTSILNPRTVLRRALCAAVGMEPIINIKTKQPRTRYHVSKKWAVELFHVLAQAGVVRLPEGVPPRPGATNGDDKDGWKIHRAAVTTWCAQVLAREEAQCFSVTALVQIARYLEDPAAHGTLAPCACSVCLHVSKTRVSSLGSLEMLSKCSRVGSPVCQCAHVTGTFDIFF